MGVPPFPMSHFDIIEKHGVCVCVCHTVAMPFTLKKSILKGKRKNYGKLKYFIMTKYNL
jgi:hypothetical protein